MEELQLEEYLFIPNIRHKGFELVKWEVGVELDSSIINKIDGGTSISSKTINRAEIIVDPDGESSSLCTACKLPIFSTPSISFSHGGEQLFMHQQCARLPPQLLHELHPEHGLVLLNHLHHPPPPRSAIICHNCKAICGTVLYQCPRPECDFRLDLPCVLQIKIVHRSHHHTMMAIRLRDSNSLTCSACDTKHDFLKLEFESESESESAHRSYSSYLCNLCGFWIHPDCASLPNAILHYEYHRHSLFLTYNLPNATHSKCIICYSVPKRSSGVYFCLNCPNYLVHIRCALTRPNSFKPVFIRDAKVSDLGRLPMPDENTSLIPYIRKNTATTDDHYQEKLHSHPLIFHKIDDDQSSRVCNACVQFISPPFFSCSQSPDFFLHSSCANLPSKIDHRVHQHPLFLSQTAPKSDISACFSCKGCELRCNGFAYSCKTCDDGFSLDVACALINPAITHDSHKKTHILFMSRDGDTSEQSCNCCNSRLNGIWYDCSICRNFKLHARCALLPNTVRHAFDKHPLQLTTRKTDIVGDDDDGDGDGDGDGDDDDDDICEVCEKHMEKERWYYSCSECNQSFHIDCIRSVDRLSRIKLGSTVRVDSHGCHVALIRQDDDAVCSGRRCGFCGEIFNFSDEGLAYECSNCFFGIHHGCAKSAIACTVSAAGNARRRTAAVGRFPVILAYHHHCVRIVLRI